MRRLVFNKAGIFNAGLGIIQQPQRAAIVMGAGSGIGLRTNVVDARAAVAIDRTACQAGAFSYLESRQRSAIFLEVAVGDSDCSTRGVNRAGAFFGDVANEATVIDDQPAATVICLTLSG